MTLRLAIASGAFLGGGSGALAYHFNSVSLGIGVLLISIPFVFAINPAVRGR